MTQLILLLFLSPITLPHTTLAQFEPCVWPNPCSAPQPTEVAQFQPCVWPNPCSAPERDA